MYTVLADENLLVERIGKRHWDFKGTNKIIIKIALLFYKYFLGYFVVWNNKIEIPVSS